MSTDTPDQHLSASQNSSGGGNGGGGADSDAETLTPLEQEVLDEYARLLGNMNNMSNLLSELAANPSAEILDALRGLERKTSLVFTLLKASVYSIVLNQQIQDEPGAGENNHDGGETTRMGGGMGMGMGMGESRGPI